MEVRVLLFGAEAVAAGRRDVRVQVQGACTCASLKRAISCTIPSLEPLLGSARVAVNSEFATPDQTIGADDEVALIGMVSGG